MKSVDVLLGLQWGDEGKGKVVDVLTPKYDVITRFQGGPNAGHTLEFNGEIVYRFYTGNDETSDFNVVRNTDNLVTMTPLKESIASPSWQVDAEDVYANVPVIVAGMHTHYYYVNKGNISSGSIVRGSSAHMKRIIRGNNCYKQHSF